MDTGESSQAQTHRGWGALSMGWCLAIMQKAFLWTTVCSIFRENHTPSTINTSFVNLEIECVHCNCCKKLDVRPLQLSILVQCQSNVVDSVDPHLPSTQTSSTRLIYTFPQSSVVEPVDPHLPSVKRRRLGWPTPSLSQTSLTLLTHTFPHFYVIYI